MDNKKLSDINKDLNEILNIINNSREKAFIIFEL